MLADVKIKLIHDLASMPTKAHEDDIGYDLKTTEVVRHEHENGFTSLVLNFGFIVNPGKGFYVTLRPRSSLFSMYGALMVSGGLIDPGYRGELNCRLVLFPGFQAPKELKPEDYHIQMVVHVDVGSKLSAVQEIDDTIRGSGGYGSTDIKRTQNMTNTQ